MTRCKYLDCDWCCAPIGVKTNANLGECINPNNCPYLKSQMKETDISTVLIEGDIATIMGVKYKRVEEPKPQTLKDIISEWIVIYNIRSDSVKDRITADLLERIETKWLPDVQYLTLNDEEYNAGWNDAIKTLKDKLR